MFHRNLVAKLAERLTEPRRFILYRPNKMRPDFWPERRGGGRALTIWQLKVIIWLEYVYERWRYEYKTLGGDPAELQ
jgi:hypothetical protein